MKRRILTSLLSLLFIFSLVPTAAFAADEADIAIEATQIEGGEEESADDSPEETGEESEEAPAEESEEEAEETPAEEPEEESEEAPAEESGEESEETPAEESEGEAEEEPKEEAEEEAQGDPAEESEGEAQVQVQAAADKGNITMQVTAGADVAQVGSTTYSTLAEAIEAAGSEGAVTLLADVDEDAVIASGTTITLDLNGYTLTGTGSGSVITVDGALTLKDSSTAGTGTVTGGSANYGGGVYASGSFTMSGGTISGNEANSNGGGVYVSSSGEFTLSGGTISGNEANSNGGGVYVRSSGEFTMTGGTISGNEATGFGGGVYVDGTLDMTGGTISGNNAPEGGGGVYVGGEFTMFGGTISGNTVRTSVGDRSLYGGGVYVGGSGKFSMNGGEISGNAASEGGGVFVINAGTFTMTGGEISENTASPDYGGFGGGVCVMYDTDTSSALDPATFTMYGGEISGNKAGDGGGVAVSLGEFTMSGGEISGNTATESGGGVSVSCSTFTMKGGTISGNEAVYGGGLAVQYSEATMSDGEISGNTASGGGGVYIFGYEYAESQFTMNGGKISGNEVTGGGGGVFLSGIDPAEGFDVCTFIMNDGEISDNESYVGGGVHVQYGTFTMNDGEISDNESYVGGGVYVQYSTFTMNGGAISENEATYEYYNYEGYEFYIYGYGGGVYVYSAAVAMEGGAISNNSAVYGGGVIATGDVDYPCTFDMTGGEISGNTASKNGGGVCVGFKDDIFGTIYGTFDMSGGTISGNTASGYGGGVYVIGVDGTPGTFTMTGGTVSGNTSSSDGGGVYVDSYGALTMSSGTVSGNTATGSGDGVCVTGAMKVSGSPVVSGNTEDNVYLPSGTYITLAGALTNGASIGVTTEDEPTADAAVEITAAETSTTYYSASLSYFSSDVTAYYVRANSTGKYLELGLRTELTKDDLTVDTKDETYTGSAITKEITSSLTKGTDYTVTYSANTNAGTATITITGIGAYIGELTYTFTISPKSVTASISGTTSKVYDGTTAVTSAQGLSIELSGVVDGDNVTASATYAYDTADVGENKTITASNISLSGTAAGNYTLSSITAKADVGAITAKAISQDDFTVNTDDETYTGSEITKTIESDLTEDTDYTVSYTNNKNAGTATITITGKGNYGGTLTYQFTINPKSVTAAISGTTTKTYDGDTTVTDGDLSITLSGVVGGNDVSATAEYAYDSPNVGEGKTITASEITLAGDDAGNYTLSNKTATADVGTISPKTVTASISGTTSKVYDGTTAAQGLSIELTGVVDGDNVTASATYAYDTADVGENKTITASNISLSGTAAGNYTLSSITATANVGTISVKALSQDDFTVNTDSVTYTGSAIEKTITTSLKEGTDYTVTYDDNTNIGTAAITITGSGNYSGALTYTFTINKATPTVSLTGVESKTYDGKAISDPTVAVTLVGSDTDYTQTVTYYSVADDGTETALTGAPVDVGSYKVVVTVDAGSNYNTGTAEASFSIFAAEQEVTIVGFTDVVYDGQAHEVTVTADSDATVTVTYTDADGNAVEAPVDAGTYTAHVTVTKDNYVTVEQDVAVSIVKATQDVTIEGFTDVVYDGQTHEVTVTADADATVSVTYTDADGNAVAAPVNAGTYTAHVTVTRDNYVTVEQDVEVSIVEAEQDVTIEGFTDVIYDGQTHEVTVTADADATVTVTYTDADGNTVAAPVNAGTYTAHVTVTKDNYVTVEQDVVVSIVEAEQDVTIEGFTDVVYDGQTHEVTVTADADATVSVTYTDADGNAVEAPVNAGTYTAHVTVTRDNYVTVEQDVEVSIVKAMQDVTIEGFTDVVYDGQTHEVTVTADANATVTVTYTDADGNTVTAPVNAGTYTAHVTVTKDNYVTVEQDVAVSIVKATQDVTIEGFTDVVYDGQTHEVTVTADSDATVTVTYTDADGNTVTAPVNAGTYTAHVTVTRDNYVTVEQDVEVSIVEAEQNVTIEGFTDVVYDGQAHEVTVTADDGATVTVTYTDADGNTVTAPVNAGTYTAHVTVTRDNYVTVEQDVEVSIVEAEQDVTIEGFTDVVYDGQTHEVTVTADADATVTVTYTDADGNAVEAPVNAGTYTAHVTVTRDNYVTVEQDVVVSIVEAEQNVTIEGFTDVVYDGQTHEVTVTADNGATVSVTYTDADGNAVAAPVDAGTYTAHVTVTRDNYVTVEQEVEVSIAKATQDISYETTSVTVTEGDNAFTNPLTQTTVYGAITYTSSDESVATVDADGQVTIVGPGTATITATAADSKNYTEATASYTLTVEAAEEEAAEEEEEESSSSGSGKSSSSSGSSGSSSSSSSSGSSSNASTTSSSKTGDESNVGLWLTLAITASFGLLAIVIYSRKRGNDQE